MQYTEGLNVEFKTSGSDVNKVFGIDRMLFSNLLPPNTNKKRVVYAANCIRSLTEAANAASSATVIFRPLSVRVYFR